MFRLPHNLPTIEDWLALKDWSRTPNVTEGTHGEYFWVRCESAWFGSALSTTLFMPTEFRVLVTYWDGNGADFYRNEPGWKAIGDYALGPPLKYFPELNFGAQSAAMLIPHTVPESQLEDLLDGFDDFQPYRGETAPFWNVVDRIKPICYFSDLDEGIFVAQGKELYELGFNESLVAEITNELRVREQRIRQSTWNTLGPECGPEKCVEPGCDHLRIRLAIRCLLHQLNCGWKTQEY